LARHVYDEQFRGRIFEFARDSTPRSLTFLLVSAGQNDLAATLSEPTGDLKTDPCVGSGDQAKLTLIVDHVQALSL
jgi:hypothetical protein